MLKRILVLPAIVRDIPTMSHVFKAWLQAILVLALVGWSSTSWAQLVQWSSAEGGNNHWYELILTPASWSAASTAAEARMMEGVPGHLATITSEDERLFLVNNLTSGVAWLGGFQDGGKRAEPDGKWKLVTGEPFLDFWNPGEPNNFPNDSDCLELREGGLNDRACSHSIAYVVEYDTVVPEPIEQLCPCDNNWKNYRAYVRCVANATEDFVADGLLTEAEKDIIDSGAAQSSCGKKE